MPLFPSYKLLIAKSSLEIQIKNLNK